MIKMALDRGELHFDEDYIASNENKKKFKEIMKEAPRPILISGPTGVGKTLLAKFIANQWVEDKKDSDQIDNNLVKLVPSSTLGGGASTILDMIKQNNGALTKKVFIIDEFHTLSRAAQESFLKPLEDKDHTNVTYIFTTTERNKILPTLIGRCLDLQLTPPSLETIAHYLHCNTDDISESYAKYNGSVRSILNNPQGKVDIDWNNKIDNVSKAIKGQAFYNEAMSLLAQWLTSHIVKYNDLEVDSSMEIKNIIADNIIDLGRYQEMPSPGQDLMAIDIVTKLIAKLKDFNTKNNSPVGFGLGPNGKRVIRING